MKASDLTRVQALTDERIELLRCLAIIEGRRAAEQQASIGFNNLQGPSFDIALMFTDRLSRNTASMRASGYADLLKGVLLLRIDANKAELQSLGVELDT